MAVCVHRLRSSPHYSDHHPWSWKVPRQPVRCWCPRLGQTELVQLWQCAAMPHLSAAASIAGTTSAPVARYSTGNWVSGMRQMLLGRQLVDYCDYCSPIDVAWVVVAIEFVGFCHVDMILLCYLIFFALFIILLH